MNADGEKRGMDLNNNQEKEKEKEKEKRIYNSERWKTEKKEGGKELEKIGVVGKWGIGIFQF